MIYNNADINANEITGLEALLSASLDAGVRLVTGVAGYPATLVMDLLIKHKNDRYSVFWMTNEKAALEKALGASVTGKRAMVIVKHVGMNVLSDPLMTSVYHTIGAGVVIIAGDDAGARASQNEQDSRFYGSLAEVAVFDPATPQGAYDAAIRAFVLSEQAKSPVIIRVTDRLLNSKGSVIANKQNVSGANFDKDIWKLTTKGKHQRFHIESMPLLEKEVQTTPLNKIQFGNDGIGIISSGYASLLVDKVLSEASSGDCAHLALQMVAPFPFDTVSHFISKCSRVLVIEETEPYIESHIAVTGKIKGKMTGHIPYGQVEAEHIKYALEHLEENILQKYTDIQTIKSRGPRFLCPDCPFMPLYRSLAEINVMVAGDMGCSIRAAAEPLQAIDTGFALGSAISTACGFENKGIAVIGDFALAHSGIIGLINAVHSGDEVVVVILQNRVAAMTGGQEAPDLMPVIKVMVADTTIIEMPAYTREMSSDTTDLLIHLLQSKLAQKGVSVIYLVGKCTKQWK
ncbi:MAG: indolepyruvate ferredoxin oxidoreductase subunit alpha [Methanomethylovorans sp.]|jgi:indolepyruvate ferredoxin oxidoreductase alpha subunit|nr:indolepyruvate ferredoxin oxidoreductase subunit alpha [Methanomethylovorans sp.]